MIMTSIAGGTTAEEDDSACRAEHTLSPHDTAMTLTRQSLQ